MWSDGSLAGLLFPLHPCLFEFSLLSHLFELKLKLPLPLVVQASRSRIPSGSIFPSGLDQHRRENSTDYHTEYEIPHRYSVRLLSV